jgi:carboxymethylenebutenolidase
VAGELAREGYAALAVDLYGGKSTSSRGEAEQLRKAVDPASATDTLVSWVGLAAEASQGDRQSGDDRLVLRWRLVAQRFHSDAGRRDYRLLRSGRSAGRSARPTERPALGHFATRDQWINRPMVEGFERAMAEAGKPLTIY